MTKTNCNKKINNKCLAVINSAVIQHSMVTFTRSADSQVEKSGKINQFIVVNL